MTTLAHHILILDLCATFAHRRKGITQEMHRLVFVLHQWSRVLHRAHLIDVSNQISLLLIKREEVRLEIILAIRVVVILAKLVALRDLNTRLVLFLMSRLSIDELATLLAGLCVIRDGHDA